MIAICEILSFRFETYKVADGKDYVELTRKLIETGSGIHGNLHTAAVTGTSLIGIPGHTGIPVCDKRIGIGYSPENS